MIQTHFVQHLSKGSRGPSSRVESWKLVNAIIYKLKTGVQWHLLSVKYLIESGKISYSTVYHHYRKWFKDGSWQRIWPQFLAQFKHLLDLSTAQLGGTHSLAKKGGADVGYQGRKKAKTINILCMTDRQSIVVAWSKPVSDNHNDLYEISPQLDSMMTQLRESGISTEELFLNAEAGFDAKIVSKTLEKERVILNVAPKKRIGEKLDSEDFFDELMYQQRFVIERTKRLDGQL